MKIILTGSKGIGKTTIAKELLRRDDRTPTGFFTRFDGSRERDNRKLFMINAQTGECQELVKWHENVPIVDISAFDEFGGGCIKSPSALTIMDELGHLEAHALEFKRCVSEAFEREGDIIAVAAENAADWVMALMKMENVFCFEVTEQNRNALLEEILRRKKDFNCAD